ncbi:hypothetical protein K435DRAFT_811557 [Dendrothele bispora CBS 962.96]|uniref:Uncharacterized protein n=1 Tax=Dendrothele bispora (strain CBS 962.96) TaxID=1314807 RepID=A0A4S8KRY2_DENBC|nr:hypothetical protein K435DRAFT_811557 [Dendrothele bispora CBS 962.96]
MDFLWEIPVKGWRNSLWVEEFPWNDHPIGCIVILNLGTGPHNTPPAKCLSVCQESTLLPHTRSSGQSSRNAYSRQALETKIADYDSVFDRMQSDLEETKGRLTKSEKDLRELQKKYTFAKGPVITVLRPSSAGPRRAQRAFGITEEVSRAY